MQIHYFWFLCDTKFKSVFISYCLLFAILLCPPAVAQNLNANCFSEGIIDANNDIDIDNDGLIEICNIEGLSNIRYRPDGTGYYISETSGIASGCTTDGCKGYELANDLDLQGEDWQPISSFAGIFDGNGYVIKNLTINISENDDTPSGLFGSTIGDAVIRNVGLININITGGGDNRNDQYIGGLVGINSAKIINSYATGTIDVQGLGSITLGTGTKVLGGLVGSNDDLINNSYSTVNIDGQGWVGGLIGANCPNIFTTTPVFNNRRYLATRCRAASSSYIQDSYATGDVMGDTAGGLAGGIGQDVTRVYAIGRVVIADPRRDSAEGGLIAKKWREVLASATHSHWNSETSGLTLSAGGGTSLTTVQMKSPLSPNAINPNRYTGWNTTDWDFGTSDDYPALKYAKFNDNNESEPTCSNSTIRQRLDPPLCGMLLRHQRAGLIDLQVLTKNTKLLPTFSFGETSYVLKVPTNTTELRLQLIRYNDDAVITVGKRGQESIAVNAGESRASIPIDSDVFVDILVNDTLISTTTVYTLSVEYPDIVISQGITPDIMSADEGDTFTLSLPSDRIVSNSGVSSNYPYQWEYIPQNPSQLLNPNLELSDTTTTSLTVRIPTDFIGRNYEQSDIVFKVTVGGVDSVVSTEHKVTIIKRNNSDVTLDPDLKLNSDISGTTASITVVTSIVGDDGDGEFNYRWQSLALGDRQWRDIATETTTKTVATYTVPEGTTPTLRYRVELIYTDAQGYVFTKYLGTYRTDVDIDDDGLIEVYYLEDLDAIRHQPDGIGYQPDPLGNIDLNSLGCDEDGTSVCSGYELARHLDFGNDTHYQDLMNKDVWKQGDGWLPIQNLLAVLEGNGNVISGLYIQRDRDNLGLFEQISQRAVIRNIGLLSVQIDSARNSRNIGGLVGLINSGDIINSYVQGVILGSMRAGGLAGRIDKGKIENSYVNGSISGRDFVGGLVGFNDASIVNTYVRGEISPTGLRSERDAIAGENHTTITNSYAATNLADALNGNTVNSYTRSAAAHNELKKPIAPNASNPELYTSWSSDNWDFGTSEQFPILRYTEQCSVERRSKSTDQPQCGTFLADQNDGLRDLEIISDGISLESVFASETEEYTAYFNNDRAILQLRLRAYDSDSQISVRKQGESRDYFAGTRSDHQSDNISLENTARSLVTIKVKEVFPATETEYTLTLLNETVVRLGDIDVQGQVSRIEGLVLTTESDSFTLTAPRIGGGRGIYRYEWTAIPQNPSELMNPTLELSGTTSTVLTVQTPPDFVGRDTMSSNVLFTVTAGDGFSATSSSIVVRINKTDNSTVVLKPMLVENGYKLSFVQDDISDLDGEVNFSYQWQQKPIGVGTWDDILGATTESYTIPAEYPIPFNYRVRVQYTDAQNYPSDFAFSDPTPSDYRPDIDIDNDGLIEIYYLEELDAIRYRLDGTGYRASTQASVIKAGCGYNSNKNNICRGYELIRDLDFRDDRHYQKLSNKNIWTAGSGWMPIGDSNGTTSISIILEGNGYTISNLYQQTDAYGGLFGNVNNRSDEAPLRIYNIGLLDVDIRTRSGDSGGLVGACRGCLIANSYVTGTLSSQGEVNAMGGLVGRSTTSTVGLNDAQYQNIYARVNVAGDATDVGRLIGSGENDIDNAYARAYDSESYVGKMIGNFGGTIKNSYATGTEITADNESNMIIDSYSTPTVSILKLPTAPNASNPELYKNWSTADWDFGNSLQYPILRYTKNGDEEYPACSDRIPIRNTDQPQCRTFLPDQGSNLRDLNIVSPEPTTVRTNRTFDSEITDYNVWIRESENTLKLELSTYNPKATITIDGIGTAVGSTVTTIALSADDSELNIIVTDTVPLTYRFTINKVAAIAGVSEITIEPTNSDGTVNEGSTVRLTSGITGGTHTWTLPGSLQILERNGSVATIRIPTDFVTAGTEVRNTVSVIIIDPIAQGFENINAILAIKKIDNGFAETDFAANDRALTVFVGDDPDGNPSEYIYRWQRQNFGSDPWRTISPVNRTSNDSNTYTIPPNITAGTRYRVIVSYTDAQGYDASKEVGNYLYRAGDNDDDNDGFIDIYTLEDLNAIRSQSNEQYELRRNLDFADPLSYADTRNMSRWLSNWTPIPSLFGSFNKTLEGNGYTISNTNINNIFFTGFFSTIGVGGSIRNIGLLNLNVQGGFATGGLAGRNVGSITASYVAGTTNIRGSDSVGGLVGWNLGIINASYVDAVGFVSANGNSVGGLIGNNQGDIKNSWANIRVSGNSQVGGLVGQNQSSISNSFALADAQGNQHAGGLVGHNLRAVSKVINSYAAGDIRVRGNEVTVGGLIGYLEAGSVENSYTISKTIHSNNLNNGGLFGFVGGNASVSASYWDSQIYTESDTRPVSDGRERTTAVLQSFIDAIDIYDGWNITDWDFGDAMSYPLLRYDEDLCDLDATEPMCGLLPGQSHTTGLGALFLLSNGEVLNDDWRFDAQPFSALITNYDTKVHNTSEIQLRPFAVDSEHAKIEITKDDSDMTDYFSGKSSGEISHPIRLNAPGLVTSVTIVVKDTDTNTTYTLAVARSAFEIDNIDVESESTRIGEGDEVTLKINARTINTEDNAIDYSWQYTPANSVQIIEQSTATLKFKTPDDFVKGNAMVTTAAIVFSIDVRNGETMLTTMTKVIINKVNNGIPPDISLDVSPTVLRINTEAGIDSDGAGEFRYDWQSRRSNTDWSTISRSSEYIIPLNVAGDTLYRVNVMHEDGQGYITRYETRESFILEPFRVDLDENDDGFIEIYYLDDLDEMRGHLAEMPTTCGQNNSEVCLGYELRRSLNFNNLSSYRKEINNKWISGEGWQPIGDVENPFNTVFRATTDTLVISDLYINKPNRDNIALFGVIGATARISDIHLTNTTVIGRFAVGGLVGWSDNRGSVTASSFIGNSSVDGNIRATASWAGGLVGSNDGSIVNSHANGSVDGRVATGGLVGYNSGLISSSYAHSNITGRESVGGLVGYNGMFTGSGVISNSYAAGSVEGIFNVGGLVGYHNADTITDVHAVGNVIGAIDVGGLVGGFSNSPQILRGYVGGNVTAVSANNIGITNDAIPTLVYTGQFDKNRYASCVLGGQADYRVRLPACGTPLPEQDIAGGIGNLALSNLTLSSGTLEPLFDPTKTSYEILDTSESLMQVTATANNPNATVTISSGDQSISMNSQASLMVQLMIDSNISVTLTALSQTTKEYTITLPTQPDLTNPPQTPCSTTDIDKDNDGLIDICDIEGLYAIRYRLDGAGYKATASANETTEGCPLVNGVEKCRGYELVRDLDFTITQSYRNPANRTIWNEGRGWRPLGTFANPFKATFNANGHSIANLRVNRPDSDHIGLFGSADITALISDAELSDVNVHGRFLVGALVGQNTGRITNSYTSNKASTSTVVATDLWAGGLVGYNALIINNSYASGTASAYGIVGGLVGTNLGQVINSHSESDVIGNSFIGGLVGINNAIITGSYALGAASESFYYAGGLVGLNTGRIENSYANGSIIGNERVGGLVGDNRNLINASYAIGGVDGTRLVGALAGINGGVITNSYAGDSAYSIVGGNNAGMGRMQDSEILSNTMLRSQSSITGWDTSRWDFGDNTQYPILKYTRSEFDRPECEQCNSLLTGQFIEFLLTTEEPATLTQSGDDYVLKIALDDTRVKLIPNSSHDDIVIRYAIDDEIEQIVMGVKPFIVIMPIDAQTIIITASAQDDNSVIRSSTRAIDIDRILRIQIRLLLEGLLSE